jgi:hypothetical protein
MFDTTEQPVDLAVVERFQVQALVAAHRMLHILDGLPLQMLALIPLELVAVAAAVREARLVVHRQTVQTV